MAVTVTYSNYFKYALANKQVDLDTDTIKVLLMRSGFVFDKDKHRQLKNITMTDTDTVYAINASLELTDSSNGFLTMGIVPGNSLTMSGFTEAGNNTTKIVSTVTAGTIVFTSTTGLVAEIAGDTVTVSTEDELATGFGYTQATKGTGLVTLTENLTNDRLDATFPTVTWTAAGGTIGPTPGAILHDITADVIIYYVSFGEELSALDTSTFNILSGSIRIT